MGSPRWREKEAPLPQQLHNHVLPSAALVVATRPCNFHSTPDIVRLLVTSWSGGGRQERRGRDWRDSGGAGCWAEAGRHPEQPRLLDSRFSRRQESAGQAPSRSLRSSSSEDTQAADFKSDNPRCGGRKTFWYVRLRLGPNLSSVFGGCQCEQL